ncbi:MAG: V4R domain-containing protein [Candidatus Bathyarchaeales archaeon]
MKNILEQNGGFFIEFDMLAEMENALQQLFATGSVVIITTMAKSCGKLLCQKIKSQNLSVEEALEKLCEVLEGWNWGEFSVNLLDASEGLGKLVVKNSLETRVKKSGPVVGCHFLSNFLAGFLSELFDRNIAVKERKCASWEGRICEFEFQAVKNGD